MNNETDGLVHAYLLPVGMAWKEVGWSEVESWTAEAGLLWVHLDLTSAAARRYIENTSKIDAMCRDALIAKETRPRAFSHHDGLLAIFRGVNLNPGADPEDMVSIRLWVDGNRVISTRYRRLMAVQDLVERLASASAPKTTGDLFLQLASFLVDRMSAVIEGLVDKTDELETEIINTKSRDLRQSLTAVRQQTIVLRRYLSPQRDALSRLQTEEFSWLDRRQKAQLRELTDRVIRYVEDLDAVRERAAIIQDELRNRLSEKINQNMYLLTIVSAIMLPLGFFTGLFGINVDGMPGTTNTPWAFAAVCALLGIVVLIEILVLRRLKWLDK
ncbi:MAG: zinc transporter [Gammaproteobacteria bacterium]|jgi:zinc transporter